MTYTVSSGMLNPTIPYHTILCIVSFCCYVFCLLVVLVKLSVHSGVLVECTQWCTHRVYTVVCLWSVHSGVLIECSQWCTHRVYTVVCLWSVHSSVLIECTKWCTRGVDQ